VTAGSIVNTASADSDQTEMINDDETVPVPNPQLTLDKPAPTVNDNDGSSDISAGDVLTYTITATNTGTATLTNVVIEDPLIAPASASCASVPNGATCVLTGVYTVTTTDVAATEIVNTATASSDQTAAAQASQTVIIPPPALAINKPSPVNTDEDNSGDISVGDTLTYNAGDTCVLVGTYSVTAADVASGSIDNSANATSDQVSQVTDDHTVMLAQHTHVYHHRNQ